MEALDWDDLSFFPCSCGYQICRFCWHRLRTDENGLCPACRQAFPDIPVSFNPEISAEELKKQKKRNKERRSNKDQVFKPQDLATLRVVQKNLVFVIGLSSRLTQEDLKKEFAHFGKIIKFVHNKSTAYITYSKPDEAIRAIRTLNASAAQESVVQQLQFQSQLNNGTSTTTTTTATLATPITATPPTTSNSVPINLLIATNNTATNNSVSSSNNANAFINAMSVPIPPNRLKASLGTTKYCNHFLRSQQCPKVGECMYLHEIAEAEASFTKEQMQAGKHVEYERKLMESYLAKLEWQANSVPQTNGFRVTPNHLPIHQLNQQHQTLAQQISSQLSANQLSPSSNQSLQNYGQIRQPTQNNNINHANSVTNTTTKTTTNIPIQPLHNNNNSNNMDYNQSLRDLSPNHLSRPSLVSQTLLQQNNHQPSLDHSPNHLIIRQQLQSNNQSTITNPHKMNEAVGQTPASLSVGQQQQPTSHAPLERQQKQQQLVLDSDSDDDGLDFDPISVSTSGLRDLLDQQVQQAKQLQMQNYFQQLDSNQTLANVLFQQNNRLNHPTQTNGLLGEANFNGHSQSVPSLSGLNNPTNQQQQVTWQNLSAWTNFLQRSGYGFENSR